MSKKSDDSIERIFRRVLTRHDPSSSSIQDDWMKMEQMLAADERRRAAVRSKRNKGIALSVAGLIGLLTAVYFLSFRHSLNSVTNRDAAVRDAQVSDGSGINGNGSVGLSSEELLPLDVEMSARKDYNSKDPLERTAEGLSGAKTTIDSSKALNGVGDYTQPAIADEPGNTVQQRIPHATDWDVKNSGTKIQAQQSNQGTHLPSEKRFAIPENELANIQQHPTIDERDDIPSLLSESSATGTGILTEGKKGIKDGLNRNELAATDLDKSQQIANDSIVPQAEKLSLITDSLTVADLVVGKADSVNLLKETEKADRKEVLLPYRWSIGLLVAPEFSATSMNSYTTPGESIGLRIGYQISRRLSVSTGLIRSTKKYIGSGDDYKPVNPAYWQIRTNGIVPEEIDSRCLVYELPLSVRYDVIHAQRSSIFLSAALSSFFMASQQYEYTFSGPNPGADTEWSTSRSENYLLSAGMVSAGYERNIGRSWVIGIEPYVKLSLSEIGWPNVKLFSTGGYVTLRYKFMKKQ